MNPMETPAGANPHASRPAVGDEPRRDEPDSAQTPRPLVLLADDEPGIRHIFKYALRSAGYDVVTAVDGAEAVAIFEQQGRDIDLLLFDVMMPGMDGVEACRRIRTRRPAVPVVFCTGFAERFFWGREALPERARLLWKPFDVRTLLEALAELLQPAEAAGRPPD